MSTPETVCLHAEMVRAALSPEGRAVIQRHRRVTADLERWKKEENR